LCGPNGITTQLIKAKKNVNIGAHISTLFFVLLGNIISFESSLKPSASACNKPHAPTTFGPRLRCIEAMTLRSETVKKVTDINKGIIIVITYIILYSI
jgi:hypothetical protein